MNVRIAIASVALLSLSACGDGTPAMPTPGTTTAQAGQTGSQSVPTPAYLVATAPAGAAPTPCPAIGFEDVGTPGAPVTTYVKCGFTVTASGANWTAWTGYGNPAPFIGFMSAGGVTTTGEVRLTSASGTFAFQSVDVYSSTTPIPYVITGFSGATAVFTIKGTQPNTFGKFATVTNPDANAQVDALVIQLTNPAAPCCANPVGLDNLAVK
ncbi:MAG: hypothetical protein ACM3H9_04805 [Rhodospirillaceae bacterium]